MRRPKSTDKIGADARDKECTLYEKEFDTILAQISTLILRRQSVTTTYLSVCTGISGAVAFLFKDGQLHGAAQILAVILLLFCGVITSFLWRKLIVQYGYLLGWWYQELRALEKQRNGSIQLFSMEHERFYKDSENRSSLGLTRYERSLTYVFTVVFLLFIIGLTVVLVWNRKPAKASSAKIQKAKISQSSTMSRNS